MLRFCRSIWIPALLGFGCFSQTVSTTVRGTVTDPSGAAIPTARCVLTNDETNAISTANSFADGSFTFTNTPRGTYTLVIRADGFKALTLKSIHLLSGEVRELGTMTLAVGESKEVVQVEAEPTPVQVASGERSGLVTGTQLNNLALKGRDVFALLQTTTGVVDTKSSRETTSNTSNTGIYINGARDNQKNFTVDGMTTHDTHSNGSTPFVPNMDAIAEVRILTSNYQAEYGRSAGGVISVITKSGSRDFHGTAFEYFRNEAMNANSFFNNRAATPKLPYRYNIYGYSVGGPIFIPNRFNRDRNRFFFFVSQEFTKVKRDYGSKFVTMPTALEREGDFSQSYDVNGALLPVIDPLTRLPFANNVIPKARLSASGTSVLNFFPLPNYVDPDPRNRYRYNYRSAYSGDTPRTDTIARIDANISSQTQLYYRFGKDSQPANIPWDDWKTGSTNFLLSPIQVDQAGWGHLVHLTQTISPTMVAEVTYGFNKVARTFDYQNPDAVSRQKLAGLSQWYPDAGEKDYVPNLVFGGQPANTAVVGLTPQIPNVYANPYHSLTATVSKVVGKHALKIGIAWEHTLAQAPTGNAFRGQFDFGRDVNNPYDTGNSFSNAALGYFRSYTEATRRNLTRQSFRNTEWFIQDNWRVTKRLALDYGIRFYNLPPIAEASHLASTFDISLYNAANAPALYFPAINAEGKRVAINPLTGVLAPAPLIGQFVPNSGNPANGMGVGGENGYPTGLAKRPFLAYGPRFGFAYDVFGTGRTAIRGGWGMFADTGQNNPFSSTTGNPPVSYTPTLFYDNLGTYAENPGAIGPSSMSAYFGEHRSPTTMNFSLGIQQQMPGSLLLDVAYVGALSRHLFILRNINPIAQYARFDPANGDPTQPGKPLPDNFLRPYKGYGDINVYENSGSSNYHALQASLNRRFSRGLQFGVSYTWSKALGVADSDTSSLSPYFSPRSRNYGPMSFDRTHIAVINYMYDLPKLGSRINARPAKWVLDNWQVSGITTFSTGAPLTPSYALVDGADLTGSSETARINVVGDPWLAPSERTFYRNFNTAAFARPAKGDFGNGGSGILRGPGFANWDVNATKRFPLFSESRWVQFRAELFNIFNHTQFDGMSTTARFDTNGQQVDPNFGTFTSAKAPRTIQLSLKVVF